ncbi:UDP-N-acetylmuramate--L-alanine ligase [Mariniluteicoccus flavus]
MSSVFGSLVPPVDLVAPGDLGAVHFIAIGGAGMSGIARAYAGLGIEVSGSDQAPSEALDALAARGVRTHVGHAADQLGRAETVVVSSAIREDNPELVEARRRGLRVWHRSAALGALMLGRSGIAVGGTHGKTTTTGMIAHILLDLGRDPGFVVGAPLATTGESAALGAPDAPFVVEADESDGSFLQYPAAVAVVTNIEADHLDNWETPQAYAEGFRAFVDGADTAWVNLDDSGIAALLAGREGVQGFGSDPAAALPIADVVAEGFGTRARVGGAELALRVPGRHNVFNAAAAIGAVVAADPTVTVADACGALATFRGTHRRFTPVGAVDAVEVFDDYAHHPTELSATLGAARAGVAGRGGRVIAVFQPHLFSRTRDFAAEFGEALALADEVVLMDIYGAREEPMAGVTSALIAEPCRAAGGAVHEVHDRGAVAPLAASLAGPGDVVLTLGAGDVTRLAPDIVAALRRVRPADPA